MSYAILGGRCRNCRVKISPIYPAVELLVGSLYALLYLKDGLTLALLGDIVFVSLIVPLVFIDLEHKLLLNALTYPGIIILFAMRLIAPVADTQYLFGLTEPPAIAQVILHSLLGAIVGGGSLWLVRWLYFKFRKVEGMGLGDIKMMLMVGAYLGWQLTLLTIFIGSFLGALIGMMLIALRGGNMKMEIPFGVFLGPASIIALLVGRQIITWYLGMYQ
jgi:leader peptidase (prepilin peptidase)/N-methyltransferase